MVFWLSLILLLYGVVAEKVAENVTEKAYQFEDDDYVEYRTVRWELPPRSVVAAERPRLIAERLFSSLNTVLQNGTSPTTIDLP